MWESRKRTNKRIELIWTDKRLLIRNSNTYFSYGRGGVSEYLYFAVVMALPFFFGPISGLYGKVLGARE